MPTVKPLTVHTIISDYLYKLKSWLIEYTKNPVQRLTSELISVVWMRVHLQEKRNASHGAKTHKLTTSWSTSHHSTTCATKIKTFKTITNNAAKNKQTIPRMMFEFFCLNNILRLCYESFCLNRFLHCTLNVHSTVHSNSQFRLNIHTSLYEHY